MPPSRTHIDTSPLIVEKENTVKEASADADARLGGGKPRPYEHGLCQIGTQEEIVTNRWLLPFTTGVDIQALDAALGVVQRGNATLVALSLIATPVGKRSRGVRLEYIQQSQDFLETIKYRAARFAIPIERYEIYTENVLESLETLPAKLGCEGMILVSCGKQALLLDNQEMQHMLSTVPVPAMLVYLSEQTARNWLSHVMARFAS